MILYPLAGPSSPADEAAIDDEGALYGRFGRCWFRFTPGLGGHDWEPFPLSTAPCVSALEARAAA